MQRIQPPSESDRGRLPPFRAILFAARAALHARNLFNYCATPQRAFQDAEELLTIDNAVCAATQIGRNPELWESEQFAAAAAADEVQAITLYESESSNWDVDVARWTHEGTLPFQREFSVELGQAVYLARMARSEIAGAAYFAARAACNGSSPGRYDGPLPLSVAQGAEHTAHRFVRAASLIERRLVGRKIGLEQYAAMILIRDFEQLRKPGGDCAAPGFFHSELVAPKRMAGMSRRKRGDEFEQIVAAPVLRRSRDEAVAAFERSCNEFKYLIGTEKSRWKQLMEDAKDCILTSLGEERVGSLSLLAGCKENDDPPEIDRKIAKYLVGLHCSWQEHLEGEAERASASVPLAVFMFGWYLTHPDHPGNRPKDERDYAAGLAIMPLQNMALAVLCEAFDSDVTRFREVLSRSRESWFPRELRDESYPMRQIVTRAWLAQDVLNRWLRRLSEEV